VSVENATYQSSGEAVCSSEASLRLIQKGSAIFQHRLLHLLHISPPYIVTLPRPQKTNITSKQVHNVLESKTDNSSTNMVQFSDLSNELIIAISSHLHKPLDNLHLALVNRRTHKLILLLLYKHIIFNFRESSPNDIEADRNWAIVDSIDSLAGCLEAARQRYRLAIRSLDILLQVHSYPMDFGLSNLLPQVYRLKHLHLVMMGGAGCRFSAKRLAAMLRDASTTLETLAIFVEAVPDTTNLGSLRHLSSLKSLCVQSQVLLGNEYAYGNLSNSQVNDRHRKSLEGRKLSELLPPNLQELQLHCCANGSKLNVDDLKRCAQSGVLRTCLLGEFAASRFENLWTLQTLTICLLEDEIEDSGKWIRDRNIEKLKARLDITGTRTKLYGCDIKEGPCDHGDCPVLSLI